MIIKDFEIDKYYDGTYEIRKYLGTSSIVKLPVDKSIINEVVALWPTL